MVKEGDKIICEFTQLNEFSSFDCKVVNDVECLNKLASIYSNYYDMDSQHVYVTCAMHTMYKKMGLPNIKFIDLKGFVTSNIITDLKDKSKIIIERSTVIVGVDSLGETRIGVIKPRLTITPDLILSNFFKSININQLLLEMGCVKKMMTHALISCLESNFEVDERIFFEVCKFMYDINMPRLSNPKVYGSVDDFCVNSEKAYEIINNTDRIKEDFTINGKQFCLFYDKQK